MPTTAEIPRAEEVDLELAERARDSLLSFAKMCWPLLEPGREFKMNWHIQAMCEHLEAQTRGELPELIINIPPRHMKSLTVAVFWPCWEWLFSPETRWLVASYAEQLSKRDNRKCRQLIKHPGLNFEDGRSHTLIERLGYRAVVRLLGDDWELAPDQDQVLRFENTKRGYRIATSVGGTATGEGGDRLIIDDPHKADDVHSDVKRETVLDWHDGTWTSRLNNPNTGTMTVIMQRLHEQDLTGHLLAQDTGFVHLCLPAEYEPKHPFVWPKDPRTEPGELLWGDHIGQDVLAKFAKRQGSYGYSGQFQQRPTPAEGGIFKRAWWRFYDPKLIDENIAEALKLTRLYTTWDTALKEKTSSDYTVGIAWGESGADKYVLRVVRGRWSLTEVIHQAHAMNTWLAEHVMENSLPQHYFENAAMGPDLMAALRHKLAGVTSLTADIDKEARAHAVTPALEAGNVYVPGHPAGDGSGYDSARTPAMIMDLIEECSGFPNGANDDQVDAFVYGINPKRWVSGSGRVRTGGGSVTRGLGDA